MDVIDAIHGRRSVRSYDPKPVDRSLIESVILDAAQAPPPFRGQVPWAFNVVEGVERIAAYGARAMDYTRRNRPGDWLGLAQKTRLQDLLGCACTDHHFRTGRGLQPRRSEPDAVGARARIGNVLGRLPMLWLDTPEVKAGLGIPAVLTPIAVFCLGYPATIPEPVIRERPDIIWLP